MREIDADALIEEFLKYVGSEHFSPIEIVDIIEKQPTISRQQEKVNQ